MSEENVERVRAVYESWSEGDFRASVDLFDPHVVLVLPPDFGPDVPDASAYLGPEAIATFTRGLFESWDDFTMGRREVLAAGDSVLLGVRQRGVGRTSGIPTEMRYFTLWSFRGRKATCTISQEMTA